MKKLLRKEKVKMHPIMTFIILIISVIVLSFILNLFNIGTTYTVVTTSGNLKNEYVAVESLLSLSGLKFIFSNAVSNFTAFTPLSMLLISLIGVGIMDKSGFLDSIFFVLTNNVNKKYVTFALSLIGIFASIMGDISFVILIPIAALLFKYGKRNPKLGIITAFSSLSVGVGINIFMNSIDTNMLSTTMPIVNMMIDDYVIKTTSFIFIYSLAALLMAFIITEITERITVHKLGSYEFPETENYLTKREVRGLLLASAAGLIYFLIFFYNLVPFLPFGGNLLDYSQDFYIDKLFNYNSFFNQGFIFVITVYYIILGTVYGLVTKSIENHRDFSKSLSHTLDGIGRVIVLIFLASTLIFIFKESNIGNVVTAYLANFISNTGFSGIPLIILVFFVSIISTVFLPGTQYKWSILSLPILKTFIDSGLSPEMGTLVFRAGEGVTYGLTPIMAYFIIYVSFMELYSKSDESSISNYIKHVSRYSLFIIPIWIVLFILFYIMKVPLGLGSLPVV